MTKKDFITIADTLNKLFKQAAYCTDNDSDKAAIVLEFIKALEKTNVRFDPVKFGERATRIL